MPTKAASSESAAVRLAPIVRATIEIDIEGVTPVIPHKWSEKALRMMRESQSGPKARAKREPKNPLDEAEGSLWIMPDGVTPGLPATAFKAAIVGACRYYDGITMTAIKSALFVEGEGPDQLVPLVGERTLREDTPRNATGVADLRYRYAFYPWSTRLKVTFAEVMLDAASVINLVDAAGNGGVGDWRPSAPKSHTGTFGRFRVRADNNE